MRDVPLSHGRPDVTFIIPHAGAERAPNLHLTLRSIAAQADVSVECIVVEQGNPGSALSGLPSWVKHVVLSPVKQIPFNKSWLLNVGVREAGADVLVLHDNDMVVPERYAREVLARHADGFEVVDLKRFIFYLTESSTRATFSARDLDAGRVESVIQNLTAGGTVAVSRRAWDAVGGFDESFWGWGGHDTEFWERAVTRPTFRFGYLPIVHLWHAASAGKIDRHDDPGSHRYEELSETDPGLRIEALRRREAGLREGPVPPWGD